MPVITDIVKGLAEPVSDLISEFVEDKDKANEIAFKIETMAATQAHAIAMAQIAVNKEEAKAGWFRGGWRPAIGWICAVALANNYVLAAYLPITPMDMGEMMPILLGLLGLGGLRTYEKVQGKGNVK